MSHGVTESLTAVFPKCISPCIAHAFRHGICICPCVVAQAYFPSVYLSRCDLQQELDLNKKETACLQVRSNCPMRITMTKIMTITMTKTNTKTITMTKTMTNDKDKLELDLNKKESAIGRAS